MSVERLCSVSEHTVTVLRELSLRARKAEAFDDAAMCEVTARALEAELRHVYAAPRTDIQHDEEQPGYLDKLRTALGLTGKGVRSRGAFASAELVQWLVDQLVEGRRHVIELRDPAELFATDLETVAAADRWVETVDTGPPVSAVKSR